MTRLKDIPVENVFMVPELGDIAPHIVGNMTPSQSRALKL